MRRPETTLEHPIVRLGPAGHHPFFQGPRLHEGCALLAWVGPLFTGIILSVGIGACAQGSGSGGACDPATEECACDEENHCPTGWDCVEGFCRAARNDGGMDGALDAGVDAGGDAGQSDADMVDAGPLKGFGEACQDGDECESGICLYTGTDGFCTRTCDTNDCPEDFGCYGVLGVIEQGVVSQVCVPNTNLLCSPCENDSECSTLGAHLCLDLGDGSFCSQDCSVEQCPTGYECQTVTRDGQDYRQCLPQSGSCNCDASSQGQTRPCSIQTPTGDCQGHMTCLGDQGWSVCEPPSNSDNPDEQYEDSNCDGIDGDASMAVFVATTGADGASCGMDLNDPCATIGQGLSRAQQTGRTYLFVQAGTYHEVVTLVAGVHIYGGYDSNWQRGDRNSPGHEVVIEGDRDLVDGQYLTIKAHDLSQPTTLSDLTIVGPDAQGSVNGSALSSYAVHARNAASLTIQHVTIIAGNGADGADGADGQDAPTVTVTSTMNGHDGGDADEFSTSCNDDDYGVGGSAGTNSCQGGSNPNGGAGGNGGTMDTDCSGIWPDLDARPGHNGSNAATVGTGYGHGGLLGGTCQDAHDAQSGRVQNGAGGSGGSGSFIQDGYWYARPGTGGGTGDNGTGGGGGGGSGGCDTGTDSYGAGGGGGGAGGCAARSGGGGGQGGGGSFGVFAQFSSLTLTDCSIQRGNGGSGGDGGVGGRGQSGGMGGSGGATNGDSGVGGDGGNGAHGGHGGGGGGGAGGVSYGIYTYGSNVMQTCTFTGGAAGSSGQGGASAPSAPPAERDGNPGGNGTNGAGPGDLGTCSDPNAC